MEGKGIPYDFASSPAVNLYRRNSLIRLLPRSACYMTPDLGYERAGAWKKQCKYTIWDKAKQNQEGITTCILRHSLDLLTAAFQSSPVAAICPRFCHRDDNWCSFWLCFRSHQTSTIRLQEEKGARCERKTKSFWRVNPLSSRSPRWSSDVWLPSKAASNVGPGVRIPPW